MRSLFLIAVLTLPLAASDIAVLASGARIRAERVERSNASLILFTSGGRIELDASQVTALEHVDDPVVEPLPTAVPVVLEKRELNPRQLVREAAERYGLPPEIVQALAMTESAYKVDAVSPKGAVGVMQLMPATASELKADAHDVEQNIDAGTRLLRDLLLKYQNEPDPVRRALAAYNAGSGAVARYDGVPPYRETQAYVEKVIERYWQQMATGGTR